LLDQRSAAEKLSEGALEALNVLNPLRVMGRIVRRPGKPPGTSPGTVIHTGRRKVEEPRIHRIAYGHDRFEESSPSPRGAFAGQALEDLIGTLPDPQEGVLWINIDGLHDVGLLSGISDRMGFHPLAIEDVANVGQRPKLEAYDDHLFIVVHMLRVASDGLHISDEQVSLLVGPGYLISFQEAPGDVFDPVRERLRSEKGRIRQRGSDYLAYALIDAVVDSYFKVLERLGERTEELETEVMEHPSKETMRRVHELKRELLVLRRSVWPLRELMGSFLRVEGDLIDESTRVYLRDVYDHSHQLIDTVEVLRDMTSGMRDLYLSNVSNRTNEVMKVLTIMASIFIPLTFVAGIYGMNFEYMPELEYRWAYPVVLGGMLAAGLAMLWVFRRRGWL
jgi:magnesium transporter